MEKFRQLAAIGLIIAVVIGGFILWQYMQAQADAQSLALFYSALDTYNSHNVQPGKKEPALAKADAYKQAIEQFKKAIQEYPDAEGGVLSYLYAGKCSYDLGNNDEAIQYYEDFLRKVTREDTYHYLRAAAYEGIGYVYEKKGDYKKALEWYEKQKDDTLGSVNMLAPLNLARCYAALSDNEKACKSYQEFIDAYPSSYFAETAKIGVAAFCQKPSP